MNDVAPAVLQQTGQIDFHVIKSGPYTGLRVKLKPVQPMLLNKVMTSVEVPKRPTYETKTISGRVQNLPMDAQAAKETPGGEVIWEYYQEETTRALTDQNNKVVTAILVMGTECTIPEDGWDVLQVALGLTIPTQPDLRRAHFLLTAIIDANELNDLIAKIMKLTGVSEEAIAEAEGAFRSSVRDQSERPDTMVVTGTN